MTRTNTIRAILLAAIVVTSVFVGFAGTGAAASATISLDKSTYTDGATITVTVTDQDLDTTSSADTLVVNITSNTETMDNGTTHTTASDTGNGSTQTFTTERPVADRNRDGKITKADFKLTQANSDESIQSATRNANGTATVTISDAGSSTPEPNTQPEIVEWDSAETVLLTEQGDPATGSDHTFQGTITVSTSAVDSTQSDSATDDGKLAAANGDKIVAGYGDASDSRKAATALFDANSGGPSFRKATHYKNGTQPVVEVAFTENVTGYTNIQLYNDSHVISVSNGDITQPQPGRVVVNTSGVIPDIDTVKLTGSLEDRQGNALSNTGNHSVTFAAVVQTDSYPSGASNNAPNRTAYVGEAVAITNNTTDQTFTVDGPGFSATRGTGAGSQVLVLDSDDELGSQTGTYTVDWNNDGKIGGSDNQFKVATLGLKASVEDTQVNTGDTITATGSAKPSDRLLEFRLVDDGGDTVQTVRQRTDPSTAEAEADLSASKKGTYVVEVEDLNAGVTVKTQNITVGKSSAKATFGKPKLISDEQGDVVNITINLQDTDAATLTLGGSDIGYTANVSVEDGANGDSDNTVTLQWNTYLAGTQGNPQGSTFQVTDSDDSITYIDESSLTAGHLLDAGDYQMEVRSGNATMSQAGNDIGTVSLGERSTESVQLWRAPESIDNADTPGEVMNLVDNGNLTQGTTVAQNDMVVAQVTATGLEGLMADNGWTRGSNNQMQALMNANNGTHLRLNMNQTSPGPNNAPKMVNWTDSYQNGALDLVYDAEGDTFYLIMDTATASNNGLVLNRSNTAGKSISVDSDNPETYEFNFTVEMTKKSNKQLASDDQTLSSNLKVVEGDGSIDDATAQPAEGQTVSGSTNWAPGTELTVRAKSSTFITEGDAIVQSDGTYTATLDYSEGELGDNVTLRLLRSGSELDDMDITLQEEQTTTTQQTTQETTEQTTEQTTQQTTQQTTEQTTQSTTEQTTESTTESGGTPGFTVAIGLVALIGAALLALRRDN